jgi:hypothetical protein
MTPSNTGTTARQAFLLTKIKARLLQPYEHFDVPNEW